jgi:hypothetical protein
VTPCEEWPAGRSDEGYGYVRWENRQWQAHRLQWVLVNGPIPEGLCVLHRCDNPPCVNPDHLFLGTRRDNNADMVAKSRGRLALTQCPHGHPYDGQRSRGMDVSRKCRTCAKDASARWRAKQRGEVNA